MNLRTLSLVLKEASNTVIRGWSSLTENIGKPRACGRTSGFKHDRSSEFSCRRLS